MRTCSLCNREDRPWFEDAPCSCGADKTEIGNDPAQHLPDCRALGHEVVHYFVRVAKNALTDKQQLSVYYVERGWQLVKNGERLYRAKMLCRDCVGQENLALERRRDYERCCKAARGADDQTYAQMLAAQ